MRGRYHPCSKSYYRVEQTDSGYEVTLIGVASKIAIFRGLSDFQYPQTVAIGAESFLERIRKGDLNAVLQYEYVEEKECFIDFIAPLRFLPVDDPYKDSLKEPASLKKEQFFPVTQMSFSSPTDSVPLPVNPDSLERQLSSIPLKYKKMFEPLSQLDRPVATMLYILEWLGLSDATMHVQASIRRYVLSSVFYFCHNGPFRKTYIRLGFNPFFDPGTAQLQVIELRNHKIGRGSHRVYCGSPLPITMFQVCDLDFMPARALFGQIPMRDTCSLTTGWYVQEPFLRFQRLLNWYHGVLMEGGTPDFPSSLADARGGCAEDTGFVVGEDD